jgi:sugar lactone lactonase YvrE
MGIMGGALNISSDGDQLILVSWVDNDVRIWNQEKQQRIWEKSGLNAPVSAIRYANQVVVAEHGSQRIVGFSKEGNLETIFASGLPAPTGLLKDENNLYVSDRTLGQIILVAVDGLPLAKKEVVIDGVTTPEGFVKKGDTFFIVEADLGVVTSVNLKGERKVIAKISKGSQAASPMQPPSQVFNGIAIDNEGALYVPGENDRALYKITNY